MIGITDNLLIETELIEHYVSANTLKRLEIVNKFFSANPELLRRLKGYIASQM